MDKKNRLKKILMPVAIVIVTAAVLCAAWFIYVGIYYHALPEASAVITSPSSDVSVTENEDGSIAFYPVNLSGVNSNVLNFTDSNLTDANDIEIPAAGIIFYPGAKVEYTAYAPLMESLAERGYLCILMKMPQNMAIFDINAADGVIQNYPEVEHWYMSGHSMGGAMAATYIKRHTDSFDGLILLAAYSSLNLSDTGLNVLSIYGSEDGVLSRKTYGKCKKNLPEEFTQEYVIDGGCHAYFGMYGAQFGDGTPTISNEEQIEITADVIDKWLLGCNGGA